MKRTIVAAALAAASLSCSLAAQLPSRPPQTAGDPAWIELWREFRQRHPEAAGHLLRASDRNGDGYVDEGERAALRERMHHMRAELREEREDELSARWEEFQTDHPDEATRLRRDADRNEDGRLDANERERALEVFRQQRQALAQQRWHEFMQQHPEAALRMARAAADGQGRGVGPEKSPAGDDERLAGEPLRVLQERDGARGEQSPDGSRAGGPTEGSGESDAEAAAERARVRALQEAREREEPWVEIKGNDRRSPGKAQGAARGAGPKKARPPAPVKRTPVRTKPARPAPGR